MTPDATCAKASIELCCICMLNPSERKPNGVKIYCLPCRQLYQRAAGFRIIIDKATEAGADILVDSNITTAPSIRKEFHAAPADVSGWDHVDAVLRKHRAVYDRCIRAFRCAQKAQRKRSATMSASGGSQIPTFGATPAKRQIKLDDITSLPAVGAEDGEPAQTKRSSRCVQKEIPKGWNTAVRLEHQGAGCRDLADCVNRTF